MGAVDAFHNAGTLAGRALPGLLLLSRLRQAGRGVGLEVVALFVAYCLEVYPRFLNRLEHV